MRPLESPVKSLEKAAQKKLEQILLDAHILNADQLADAIKQSQTNGKTLTVFLLEMQMIKEDALAYALCRELQIPYISLATYTFSTELINSISKALVVKYHFLPLDQFGDLLTIAISDNITPEMLQEITYQTQKHILVFVASHSELQTAMEKYIAPEEQLNAQTQTGPSQPQLTAGWESMFDAANEKIMEDVKQIGSNTKQQSALDVMSQSSMGFSGIQDEKLGESQLVGSISTPRHPAIQPGKAIPIIRAGVSPTNSSIMSGVAGMSGTGTSMFNVVVNSSAIVNVPSPAVLAAGSGASTPLSAPTTSGAAPIKIIAAAKNPATPPASDAGTITPKIPRQATADAGTVTPKTMVRKTVSDAGTITPKISRQAFTETDSITPQPATHQPSSSTSTTLPKTGSPRSGENPITATSGSPTPNAPAAANAGIASAATSAGKVQFSNAPALLDDDMDIEDNQDTTGQFINEEDDNVASQDELPVAEEDNPILQDESQLIQELDELADLLKREPSNYKAVNRYVELSMMMGNLQLAINQLLLFAQNLQQKGETKAAINCYHYILDLSPNNLPAKQALAQLEQKK